MPVVFVRRTCGRCLTERDVEISTERTWKAKFNPIESRRYRCLFCGLRSGAMLPIGEFAGLLAAPTWVSA